MKYKINEKQLTYNKMHPFQVLNSRVLRRSPEPHPGAAGISSRVLTLSYRQCVPSACPAGDLSGVSGPTARVERAPRGPLQGVASLYSQWHLLCPSDLPRPAQRPTQLEVGFQVLL